MLVIESILILHSEGAQVSSASLQTFADGDQAASQSDTSELIVETPSFLMLRDFKRSAITAVMNVSFSFKLLLHHILREHDLLQILTDLAISTLSS